MPKTKTRNILLIDDQKGSYYSLKMVFPQSHRLHHAKSCLAGLKLLEKMTFDLIIMDWMMPKKSGLECMQELKGNGIRTPVCFITAIDNCEACAEAFRKGAVDYITKPFKATSVLDRVNMIFTRKKRR